MPWIHRIDMNGRPVESTWVEEMTAAERVNIVDRCRRIYFDGDFSRAERDEVYRQINAAVERNSEQMRPVRKPMAILSTGVRIEAELKEIEHPAGVFVREDGTRFDVLCLEAMIDPELRIESVHKTDARFRGERQLTYHDAMRLGFAGSDSGIRLPGTAKEVANACA